MNPLCTHNGCGKPARGPFSSTCNGCKQRIRRDRLARNAVGTCRGCGKVKPLWCRGACRTCYHKGRNRANWLPPMQQLLASGEAVYSQGGGPVQESAPGHDEPGPGWVRGAAIVGGVEVEVRIRGYDRASQSDKLREAIASAGVRAATRAGHKLMRGEK